MYQQSTAQNDRGGAGFDAIERVEHALRDLGLKITRSGTNQFSAQCPAHEDRNPSLSVTGIESQVLMKCHSGCETESVVAALGLEMRDLFNDVHEGPYGIGAAHPYRYPDGNINWRTTSTKTFRQQKTTGEAPRALYLSDRLTDEHPFAYITEGEKDAEAVWAMGVAAVSTTGSESAHRFDYSTLRGRYVILWRDNDDAGAKWTEAVAAELEALEVSFHVVIAAEGCKDAADHLTAGKTIGEARVDVSSKSSKSSQIPEQTNLEDYEDFEEPTPLDTEPHTGPFPTGSLPPWWGAWVEAVATSSQTPTDLAGVISLGILSSTIAGRVTVNPWDDWTEPTNLFTVVAMPPGSRKSAVFARAAEPLRAAERELALEAAPNIADAAARKRMAEDRAEQLRKQASRPAKAKQTAPGAPAADDRVIAELEYVEACREAEEITVPPEPRLIADDATTEALATIAAEQGGRIAVASAEAGLLDIVFSGRYTNGTPATDLLLRGHAGDSYSVDRKGRTRERIESLCITLALTFQPVVLDTMKTIRDSGGSRGELERFLYSIPPSLLGQRKVRTAQIPQDVQAAYNATVGGLARKFHTADTRLVLTLSPAAQESLAEFAAEVETEVGPSGFFGERGMEGWGSKLTGAVARIAAVLHMASGSTVTEIPAATIDAAIELGHYFTDHAARAFWQMGSGDIYAQEREVVSLIRRKGFRKFTGNELWRTASRTRWDNAQEFAAVLDRLVDLGWLTVEQQERTGRGRPPSPKFETHPTVFENP